MFSSSGSVCPAGGSSGPACFEPLSGVEMKACAGHRKRFTKCSAGARFRPASAAVAMTGTRADNYWRRRGRTTAGGDETGTSAPGAPRSTQCGVAELRARQREVERGRGVGERADADEVDPGLRHVAHRLERDPARRLERRPGPPASATASRSSSGSCCPAGPGRPPRPAPRRSSSRRLDLHLDEGGPAAPPRARAPPAPPRRPARAWFSFTRIASWRPPRWRRRRRRARPASPARAGRAWSCGCRGSGRRCPPPRSRSAR